LVHDDRREVVHALVDESEERELHDGEHEREAQRPLVAEDVQKLFAKHGEKRAPHDQTPAAARSAAASSVSLTNTSSSDGWIARTSARGKPAVLSAAVISSSVIFEGTTV